MKILTTFILFLVCTANLFAQQRLTSKSKKAIAFYKEAVGHYEIGQYPTSKEKARLALKKDKKFAGPAMLLAQIALIENDYQEMIASYDLIHDFKAYPEAYFYRAQGELAFGKYEKAKKDLLTFRKYKQSLRFSDLIMDRLERCNFALYSIANPVEFSPENLGPQVNSPYSEYWPSLTADGQQLVFTRLLPDSLKLNPDGLAQQEDLYYSRHSHKEWSKAKEMGKEMNTPRNEGAQTISADGSTLVFTACNRNDGFGSCDLYISYKRGRIWSKAVNMGNPINTRFQETQPSLSADGKTLYFASNRMGSLGENDIWVSKLGSDKKWGNPTNLGNEINTPKQEISPFIHPDDQTLYFSSNGHLGLGNADIFFSKKNGGTWSKPANLGYPINTYKEESGFVVSANGEKAYFASDRPDGFGNIDIYSFTLANELRPNPVTYIKGKVYDAETNKNLQAPCQLIDLERQELVFTAESEESSGNFFLCLPTQKNYGLHVSKPGYLFYSENFNTEGERQALDPKLLDIPLQPIKPGITLVLKNIFFETDSFALKNISAVELNKLVDFMNLNPDIRIEIGGHTDNSGSTKYNQNLSSKRAQSVAQYLQNKGINNQRIEHKGYGEKQPKSSNDTEQGKALNRRTEMKIID